MTYTITASNAGPGGTTGRRWPTPSRPRSPAPGPAPAPAAAPARRPARAISTTGQPAGRRPVTYTATCTISAGDPAPSSTRRPSRRRRRPDPTPGNNSATDTDTLPKIFFDGFETGDTSLWSFRQPAGLAVALILPVQNRGEPGLLLRLRPAAGDRGPRAVDRIAATLDAQGRLVFAIEARPASPSAALELRLVAADGEAVRKGSWQEVAQRSQDVRLEWRSTTPGGNNGTLSLALEGRSALWLDGLTGFTGRPATLFLLAPERKPGGRRSPERPQDRFPWSFAPFPVRERGVLLFRVSFLAI